MGVCVRAATVDDLWAMQRCNLMCLPENYQMKYYLYHALAWPSLLQVADVDGAARLRYVRSIFDPEASVRRPATLPTSYPQASHFSNFANLYNLRTTYGGDRPAAEASPGMPQENWMVTQEA